MGTLGSTLLLDASTDHELYFRSALLPVLDVFDLVALAATCKRARQWVWHHMLVRPTHDDLRALVGRVSRFKVIDSFLRLNLEKATVHLRKGGWGRTLGERRVRVTWTCNWQNARRVEIARAGPCQRRQPTTFVLKGLPSCGDAEEAVDPRRWRYPHYALARHCSLALVTAAYHALLERVVAPLQRDRFMPEVPAAWVELAEEIHVPGFLAFLARSCPLARWPRLPERRRSDVTYWHNTYGWSDSVPAPIVLYWGQVRLVVKANAPHSDRLPPLFWSWSPEAKDEERRNHIGIVRRRGLFFWPPNRPLPLDIFLTIC
jgi:hypothetical protein